MRSHPTLFLPSKESQDEINEIVVDQEHYVRSNQANLYCYVVGNGPPLIIIHGGPGLTMNYLFSHLKTIASRYTLIFYDQRGNGKSNKTIDGTELNIDDSEINLATFIQDLSAIVKYFNYERVGIFGHSWGAYLALAFAANNPELVNNLIISNTIPLSNTELAPEGSDLYATMIAELINSKAFKSDDVEGMTKIVENTFRHFFRDESCVSELKLAQFSAQQLKNMAHIHKCFEKNFFDQPQDLYRELKKIQNIPTLIMHSTKNDVSISVARKLSSILKESTLHEFNAGHFPFIEDCRKFNECMSTFCNRIEKLNVDSIFKIKYQSAQAFINAYSSNPQIFKNIIESINLNIGLARSSPKGKRLLKHLVIGLRLAYLEKTEERCYLSAHDSLSKAFFHSGNIKIDFNLIEIYKCFLSEDIITVIKMLINSDVAKFIDQSIRFGKVNTNLIFAFCDLERISLRGKSINFNVTKANYLYQDERIQKMVDDEIKGSCSDESYYDIACGLIQEWKASLQKVQHKSHS